jgi:transposase InsO family protein
MVLIAWRRSVRGRSPCSAAFEDDTARPPAGSARAQQSRFDAFRRTFNQVRPHEALDQRRPAALYMSSDRL